MDLIARPSPTMITMSSRDIAVFTAKEHGHVMRDIRNMCVDLKIDESNFGDTYFDASNRLQPQFRLPYNQTMCLLTGYDAVARMAVIERWQKLEAQAAPQVPKTYAAALRLAAEQQDQLEAQQLQLEHQKPAVAFVQQYVESTGLKGFREVCKLLKANEAEFRKYLIDNKVMYRLGGALTAHQNHIDAGRFEVRTGVADSEHAYTTTKFSPKGVAWVAGEWAKHQIAGII